MKPPLLILLLVALTGCAAPSARLTFPAHPLNRSARGWFYDLHNRHHPDFALLANNEGRIDSVAYDDAGAGKFNRVYRLADYANADVPHLVILLDSVPYQAAVDWYAAGHFRFCDPPQKVIPPFPSLTEICYSRLLGAPPLSGMVDDFYDRDAGQSSDTMWHRVLSSYREPWEQRLDYGSTLYQSGLSFLRPREWYAAELAQSKIAFDKSPNRVTLVYLGSASSMLCKYGKPGLDEVLAGAERLCLQLLYERQGALKITLMADHGHNLTATENISLEPYLKQAGFHISDRLSKPRDVVLELHGLVTYAGVRTNEPAEVSAAICKCPQIDMTVYLDGPRLIIRNAYGTASIECRDHKLRYLPIDYDVLGYAPVIARLTSDAKADPDGYIADADWFPATLDHEYPDAPRRLWDAFHGAVTHPPEIMFTTRDGYCAGKKSFESFIKMASTHGSLNQANSATFLMSMTGRVTAPLRTGQVLSVIEHGFVPQVKSESR